MVTVKIDWELEAHFIASPQALPSGPTNGKLYLRSSKKLFPPKCRCSGRHRHQGHLLWSWKQSPKCWCVAVAGGFITYRRGVFRHTEKCSFSHLCPKGFREEGPSAPADAPGTEHPCECSGQPCTEVLLQEVEAHGAGNCQPQLICSCWCWPGEMAEDSSCSPTWQWTHGSCSSALLWGWRRAVWAPLRCLSELAGKSNWVMKWA